MAISAKDFGVTFQEFMKQMAAQGPAEEPVFLRRLRSHFEQDPSELPIVRETFPEHDHPNIQMAMDEYLARQGRSADVVGIAGVEPFMGVSLSRLAVPSEYSMWGGTGPREGPVEYVNVPLGEDRVLTCVQQGLYFISDGRDRLAVVMQGPLKERHYLKATVEVMAPTKEAAESFLSDLRTAIRQRSIYRGHVLSLSQEHMMGSLQVQFHQLPSVDRANIILPEGLLERIERQTIRFSEHSRRLLEAGRHLKRGILLHGPPGTGKTLTVMYLARAIQNRTVLLLTGRALALIEPSCNLARALQPSIVVLEDVDLVAEERTHRAAGCATPLLFELLNEMDGLADDADVLFLLTTNRPDLLEPALAARPGRIDQAIELPLPDETCRRRLFDLYGRGLELRISNFDRHLKRTEGASPAFIRELLRRAALFAADEGEQLVVEDRHLDEALRELIVQGGTLTRSLLGFRAGDTED